ncbi:MAG: hypothetical protein ACFBSG_20635 [Leptolyngbyaceae cyanobacterium]
MPRAISACYGIWAGLVYDSYRDGERLRACLAKSGWTVRDSWQHRGIHLEDFGWEIALGDQRVRVDVYDDSVRNCRSRVLGIQLMTD